MYIQKALSRVLRQRFTYWAVFSERLGREMQSTDLFLVIAAVIELQKTYLKRLHTKALRKSLSQIFNRGKSLRQLADYSIDRVI